MTPPRLGQEFCEWRKEGGRKGATRAEDSQMLQAQRGPWGQNEDPMPLYRCTHKTHTQANTYTHIICTHSEHKAPANTHAHGHTHICLCAYNSQTHMCQCAHTQARISTHVHTHSSNQTKANPAEMTVLSALGPHLQTQRCAHVHLDGTSGDGL